MVISLESQQVFCALQIVAQFGRLCIANLLQWEDWAIFATSLAIIQLKFDTDFNFCDIWYPL